MYTAGREEREEKTPPLFKSKYCNFSSSFFLRRVNDGIQIGRTLSTGPRRAGKKTRKAFWRTFDPPAAERVINECYFSSVLPRGSPMFVKFSTENPSPGQILSQSFIHFFIIIFFVLFSLLFPVQRK